jgi:hypothetical protein
MLDSKVLLRDAYSGDDQSSARPHGERARLSTGASLTLVLLTSLGLWAAIWGAVKTLAWAVLL